MIFPIQSEQRRKSCSISSASVVVRRTILVPRDLRWRDRSEAWRSAEFARQRVNEGADVDWVIQLAKAVGFFSVWMTVFADDIQMCARLRRSFPGTR